MDDELVRHYQRAHYRVADQGTAFTMLIDRPCPELEICLARARMTEAAYITAWNPRSIPTVRELNDAAQQGLLAELAALGCGLLHGDGVDPEGSWPPEPSVLALGITHTLASELGRRFGQNAIVVASAADAATPRLLLLF